jgi:hypothetical protein
MRTDGGWTGTVLSYEAPLTADSATPPPAAGSGPELADVGRLARRVVKAAVNIARADESTVEKLLAGHLGAAVASLPVASGAWPRYDQVNVQAGLNAWLAADGRGHTTTGLVGFQNMPFGLSELAQANSWTHRLRLGSVTTDALPSGPGGATLPCVQCALYLVTGAGGPLALLVRGPDEHQQRVIVEVTCDDSERGRQVIDEIRRLSVAHNVFRGHVIEFGEEVFGYEGGTLLSFRERPHVARDRVVLPSDVLDGIERQVLGVARHAGRLLASGQHLKRGLLLHGVPGTGKTHTVRYLLGQLSGVTVVLLSGGALGLIAEACSVARTLQPSVVVVEDVDLIAEEREIDAVGAHSLLFQLLNEMDGLRDDLDVAFLLTTNRADLLEPALAQRPGRVDHAALLPLPDAAARYRLLQLYRGNLELELADPDAVLDRTEGVTASFIKELLRRAALRAAEEAGEAAGPGHAAAGHTAADQAGAHLADAGETGDGDGPLLVSDRHLSAALDELLDSRNQLTRVLLGGRPGAAPGYDATTGGYEGGELEGGEHEGG